MSAKSLPVAVIGAGPVGLAAAAQLASRGEPFVVLEAGSSAGASVRRWGHVRIFSPWQYNVDATARAMLHRSGWTAPPDSAHPTGQELVEQYLQPLAELPGIRPHLRFGTRVLGVSRLGVDRTRTTSRDEAPFVVRVSTDGVEEDVLARAVIDASGTYDTPNPLGASGLPALGEKAAGDRIHYGIPDVFGRDRARYAGRRVLVVGSGHSAFGTLLDLATLREEEPGTEIVWAIRKTVLDGRLFGGGGADQLAERGRLGQRVASLLDAGALRIFTGFHLTRVEVTEGGVVAASQDQELPAVDEIVAVTGFRPDLGILRDVRMELDAVVESPAMLAPLIDPNVHSCGSVPPHGFEELKHPEADFYVVGMKSYGRAPTFLMLTGYEQVRSVVAALAGDLDAAHRVELQLPETGVCSTDFSGAQAAEGACCGTSAPEPELESVASCSTGGCAPRPVPLVLGRPATARAGCC